MKTREGGVQQAPIPHRQTQFVCIFLLFLGRFGKGGGRRGKIKRFVPKKGNLSFFGLLFKLFEHFFEFWKTSQDVNRGWGKRAVKGGREKGGKGGKGRERREGEKPLLEEISFKKISRESASQKIEPLTPKKKKVSNQSNKQSNKQTNKTINEQKSKKKEEKKKKKTIGLKHLLQTPNHTLTYLPKPPPFSFFLSLLFDILTKRSTKFSPNLSGNRRKKSHFFLF